ncbi:hypothetical protein [Corynebacterium matruchotii]|uniref:hypothetical protein n=1 Tax=Corynebacterium matruchotii TaxID=43768 RepID=UPI003C756FB1
MPTAPPRSTSDSCETPFSPSAQTACNQFCSYQTRYPKRSTPAKLTNPPKPFPHTSAFTQNPA